MFRRVKDTIAAFRNGGADGDSLEPCIGCGAMSVSHPFVGVTRDKESGEMAAFPVCAACWKDPAHRKTVLKMHFFPREKAKVAVAMAGSNAIGG